MNNERQQPGHASSDDRGRGQQGTGGVENGQATGTPTQGGKQPHLGSQPDADSGAGGTGLSENDSDGAADIAAVDRIDEVGMSGQQGPDTDATGAASGADATDTRSDRLDDIERADERTEQSARERERDIGAQTPGDPGDLLSQPLGDGNYQKQGDEQIPLAGNPDPGTGG